MLQYNKNSITVAYQYLDIIKSLLLAPIPVLIILISTNPILYFLIIIYLFFLPFFIAISSLLNRFKLLSFLTILLTTFGVLIFFKELIYIPLESFFSELVFSWVGISTLITAFNFWALLTWYNYKDNKIKEQNIHIE
ncbi:hypothetical protein AOLE_01895 [Acinetobacter oleivorans DR1]|uniref:Uncharacterized protein n=1 Tax=Acinetobacter oleivorans (strain JCM 16667 / KCTC 23045 / DR1) TaxID=436717 RepID=A0AAN0UBR2_ACISD|nr:hypothetical protein AOLE_01895 [Acinetobacter oleivorans DR1]ESK42701.1 hypothetical protein P254_03539 [Acinetobacter oleivorans CIP 110421]